MKFTLDNPDSELVFSNYSDHSVTINKEELTESLIVFPDMLHKKWAARSVSDLTMQHFDLLVQRRPDIIILGTGNQQKFPTIEMRRQLAASQLQLDVMDIAAACRTYNLLVSEDRDVAAAIILGEAS